MSVTPGTHTLLQLCCTMDVKGTMSGKNMIHKDHKPVDVLGFMLQEHGYKFHRPYLDSMIQRPNGGVVDPYEATADLLGVSRTKVSYIYQEIDRYASTNKTIKEMVIRQCNVPPDIAQQYRSQGTTDEEFDQL